jgi:hypothetical protein
VFATLDCSVCGRPIGAARYDGGRYIWFNPVTRVSARRAGQLGSPGRLVADPSGRSVHDERPFILECGRCGLSTKVRVARLMDTLAKARNEGANGARVLIGRSGITLDRSIRVEFTGEIPSP